MTSLSSAKTWLSSRRVRNLRLAACAGALLRCQTAMETEATAHVDAAAAPAPPLVSHAIASFLNIPPQCYTRTRDDDGTVHNPCYTCHVTSRAPNYIGDQDLQLAYAFPGPARTNPWTNLFVDRRPFIASVPDDDIDTWVRRSNYLSSDRRELLLAKVLTTPAAAWDLDQDGRFTGYHPDAWFDFDADGMDHAPDGSLTGWRAFAYYPLPGSFFPTNGSSDDVLIRLPREFRERSDGEYDGTVYKVNLAIVESLIRREDVPIDAVDERELNLDLNGDGHLGRASLVKFDWAPLKKRFMHYVGRARAFSDEVTPPQIAAGMFPVGTEFIHSVRYLDEQDGRVVMAPRMKELRYARKHRWVTYGELETMAQAEAREKRKRPDRAPTFRGNAEVGLWNGRGWRYQGYIENSEGELRPQTSAELATCIGCHGGMGTGDDSVISFGRKLRSSSAHARGWYHWSGRGFDGLAEPKRADGQFEYTHYLARAGAGDELRSNDEVRRRFFDEAGQLRSAEIAALHSNVATLLVPSPARARALNKAYLAIVKEQSYVLGRAAVLTPANNVWRELNGDESTGVESPLPGVWQRAPAAQLSTR